MIILFLTNDSFLFPSLADLSVGLLSVLTDIVQRITISWLAGNVACKVIRFIQVWVTYASTYVLVALSIDRYDAITHPMNFSGCCKSFFVVIHCQSLSHCVTSRVATTRQLHRGEDILRLVRGHG